MRSHGVACAALTGVTLVLAVSVTAHAASHATRSGAPSYAARADTLASRLARALEAGDVARAAALADSAMVLREKRPGARPLALASFLDSLGIQFFSLGTEAGWAASKQRFVRSLAIKQRERGSDDLEVASTLGALATLDDYLGHWEEAAAWARRSLAIRVKRLGAFDLDVATSRRQLGMLQYQLGNYAQAESLVAGALLIAASKDTASESVAGFANDLGEIVRVQNRDTEAERYFRRGLEIAQRALPEDATLRVALLNNLAGLYRDRARYADAEPLLEESLRLRQRSPSAGPEAVATACLNLAEIYRLQGRNDEAAPLYARALDTARPALGADNPSLAPFVNQAAVSFQQAGRLAEAEPLYREGLANAERALGPDHPLVAQSLNDLGSLLEQRGAWAAAESTYRRAVTIRVARLGARHPDVGVSQLVLARTLWHAPGGNRSDAGETLARALAILDSSRANPEERLEAHALRAEISTHAGHPRAAVEDLATALDLLDSLRAQRGGGDETRARFVERNLGLYHRMAALHLAAGEIDAAFDAHERGRARVLRDQIAASGVDLSAGIPPAELAPLAHAEDAARDALARSQRALDAARTSGSLGPAERLERVATLEAERDHAGRDLQRAIGAIKDRSPIWRSLLGGGGHPVTRVEVQAALQPGEALLEYHVGEDAAWAFLIERDGHPARAFALAATRSDAADVRIPEGPLTAGSVERVVAGDSSSAGPRRPGIAAMLAGEAPASTLGELAAESGTALERRLEVLRRLLVPEPLWRALRRSTSVVVIPDGALHLLPFEALVLTPRDPNHGARFWLDDGPALRYAASASSWLALEARRSARKAATSPSLSALSVSDPRFDRVATSTWARLPATRLETRALVAALAPAPVAVLQGDSATEHAARAGLRGKRILHLATHGFVTSRGGDVLAGLVFTPSADPTAAPDDDGLLQLYEIYELGLDADLAVLSACQTARGTRVAGEGVFALSRGFLAAGASRVIASLWAVNDASTATLVSALFRDVPESARRRGEPDWTRLLRDAKRSVRSRPEWSEPFHWAPFVLSGTR